ncbi:MobA/MobL family protein [bacterium]|nr:MobA/MobL family protein [bacterium]
MAIFHLSVKSGSRNAEQSAAAHGEYIAREGKYAVKAVAELAVHVEHGNLPAFAANDPHAFWRAADTNERANGRLWTELEVSIPRELSRESQLQLVRDFRDAAIGERHAFSLAVHVPKTLDGQSENPHMHLMFSERVIDERTKTLDAETYFKRNGATKDRAWNEQTKVEEIRTLWESMANKALERAGSEERIDRRSLAAQGAQHVAEPKIGRSAPEVRRALKDAQSGQSARPLSERAQTAMQVRALRQIAQQQRGVVIELAKVREERQRKATEREVRLKRFEVMPLAELRREAQRVQPSQANPGRPAWEREWIELPEVANSANARDATAAEVGYARGRIGMAERDLAQATNAEQGYRKQHKF